jgi:diguanylate cyclase (GGDEF)-like protein
LSDTSAVPVLVQSATRDPVEALNSLLRNSGLAVHCTWIPAVQDIADALEQLNPQLLVVFAPSTQQLIDIATIRDRVSAQVPLIVIREDIDPSLVAEDMARGARDTLSVFHPDHVQAVIRRELRAFRVERTLSSTLHTAQEYRHQLETVLRGSNDAIAQVQEGIVVDANSSWLELFGFVDGTALIGQPAMDLFDADTQVPLKGALAACLQGRWSGHVLKAGAQLADGSVVPIDLQLIAADFEGEPCVRLLVPAQRQDDKRMATDLADAVHRDPSTGLWTRRYLLEQLAERLATPAPGGVRYMACVRPDKFSAFEREVGVLASEDLLSQFATLVSSMLGPNDIAGSFGGTRLLLLLERGNTRDIEAWSEELLERVGRHPFQIGDRTLQLTASAGVAPLQHAKPDMNGGILDAVAGMQKARDRGGNQLEVIDHSDQDARVQAYDQIWVKHIRAALMENRFRLVQQPIASLNGSEEKVFDVAIRMLDTQGREVLPSEFLPAAARNDLMKNIDRWVLGASLSFLAKRGPDLLFVRLSRDSLLDGSLIGWLDNVLKASQAEPQRLCLQVTEDAAGRNAEATQTLATELKRRHVRFALEHFGTGRNFEDMLTRLKPDFVKIDGSLMQGLSGNPELQERVRSIAKAAEASGAQTVAERIEDANTMAVVWQLGVQYIQGYLVHAPEQVVLKS